jgi:hypothetical protein
MNLNFFLTILFFTSINLLCRWCKFYSFLNGELSNKVGCFLSVKEWIHAESACNVFGHCENDEVRRHMNRCMWSMLLPAEIERNLAPKCCSATTEHDRWLMHRTLCFFFFFLDQIVRVVRKIDHASPQAIGFPHFCAILEKLGCRYYRCFAYMVRNWCYLLKCRNIKIINNLKEPGPFIKILSMHSHK